MIAIVEPVRAWESVSGPHFGTANSKFLARVRIAQSKGDPLVNTLTFLYESYEHTLTVLASGSEAEKLWGAYIADEYAGETRADKVADSFADWVKRHG